MATESEDFLSKGGIDSPSADETSNGENTGGGIPLKKGPWTSAEDAILVDYVTKHGEGNWNAVHKHSGLARCGKSCRLRWANHLRPDLKKGAITPDEERRIIELHAKMGNKWARMAAELPGRTDNEIKNYWNTRIKRRQRAGLPIYPPDICLQAFNENQQIEEMGPFSSGNAQHSDLLPVNSFEIPAVEFKNLELNQHLYPSAFLDMPASSLLDIPASSLLGQGLNASNTSKSLFSTMHPSKRLRGSEPLFPGLSSNYNGVSPACNQYQSDGSEQIAQSFGFYSAYDHNFPQDHPSSSRVLPGSHAFLNGDFSSSEPTSWAMKLELPSLQTHMGNWGSSSSPLPSLESVDTLIQSPPTEHTGSGSLSPRNSGLLDAVLYESQSMKNSKNNSFLQTSASVSPGEMIDNSSQDVPDTEWEAYGDPTSPLGHSVASVFNEHTPNGIGSLGECQTLDAIPGCKVKQEAVDLASLQSNSKNETSNEVILSRSDVLLGSNCFSPRRENSGRESFQAERCNWGTSW